MHPFRFSGVSTTLLFVILMSINTLAQQPFQLNDGDRVVLLGAGLVENEQKHGWLEYVLSSTWPDRYISFRNLGWTGDTVFGQARTYFTTPPTPFELLIQQVREADPSVIFLAYGQIESEEGKQGLDSFTSGMNTLLDSLQKSPCKIVLINPIRTEKLAAPERQTIITRSYQHQIEETAEKRGLTYLDVGTFLNSLDKEFWETDVLLNEDGYAQLATYLRKGLAVPMASHDIQLDWKKKQIQTGHAVSEVEWDSQNTYLSFSLAPKSIFTPISKSDSPKFTITGLKKGSYGLRIDGELVAIGARSEWEMGKELEQGPWLRQAENLRKSIQKKDEIYFRKYRPQNRTYILGFRAYEQGRHEDDLKDLGLLVAWLDGQIHRLKQPKTYHVELFPIQ